MCCYKLFLQQLYMLASRCGRSGEQRFYSSSDRYMSDMRVIGCYKKDRALLGAVLMYGFEATTFYSCMLPRSSLDLASLLSVINKNIYLCLDHPHVGSGVQKKRRRGWLQLLLPCKWASVKTKRKGRRWWYAAGVLWTGVMGHNSTSTGGSGSPWA